MWKSVLRAGLGQVWSVLIAVVIVLSLPEPADAQTTTFQRIDVVGNQRIEADTIRVISGIQPGQPVSPDALNAGLQRLFDSGLFEDVKLNPTAGRLEIAVVENPTINFINFEGNTVIEDEILATFISLQPRRAFSRAAAERDAQVIVEAYSQNGRFNAEVTPVLIRLPDNRVNLVFEIVEGSTTEVKRINFIGNKVYSDRRLRRVIDTGQANFLSFLFSNDIYDQDRLELDKQLLREFYLERGYVDFEVRAASAELSRERNGFFLSFNLFEGEKYTFGETFVSTLSPALDPDEFEELLDIRPGQTYSAKRVERQIERLSFLAGQKGFAFVQVQPRINKNEAERIIDIDFELVEGPRVFVERIDIRGNTQTLDRVIRRQFRVVEGDAFNAREIENAENRIRALRYFESVEARVREGSAPDRAVVAVDVEEAPTGSLNFGAAYSSSDGVTGNVSLTERNFLGRGQTVGMELSAGSDIRNYSLSFTEPALFDQDLLYGFQLFFRERDREESGVSTENIGLTQRIGFPLTENSRLTLRYRISTDEIIGADPDTVSPILVAEEDRLTTSAIGFTYSLDRRNSPIDPTAGFILRFDQDFAGVGGDTEFSKSVVNARVFTSFFEEDVVLSAELEGGALVMQDGNSRISDRFFLGGDSFRGFDRGGLGPRDRCDACIGPGSANSVNDSLGGNYYAIARLEASFPIGFPEEYGVFGGVFLDTGTVWGLDDVVDGASGPIDDGAELRSAVGVSLFWDTAIGPLRFNFAKPLKTVEGDEEERFRLTVDTRF